MGLAERGRGQIMNLNFDETLATNYKSFSQKVRVMSEGWFLENLFCPCCGNSCINKIKNNAPVADMYCQNRGEIFEIKSKKKSFWFKNYGWCLSHHDVLRDKGFIEFIGRGRYSKLI